MPRATVTGRVIALTRGWFEVETAEGIYRCQVRGRLRKEIVRPQSKNVRQTAQAVRAPKVTTVVAVGDRVEIVPMDEKIGVIERVFPRDREFVRRAAGTEPLAHTILAGLDQIVAVFSTREPEPHLGMLDRLLVTAENGELASVICINKVDLGALADLADDLAVYRSLGYPVVATSTCTGAGLDELRARLAGRTSAFVGPSGVGKSSLINALVPGANLKEGEISAATGKGRHTTRSTRLLALDGAGGGQIADTPGLREFGLWQIAPDDRAHGFVEFRPFLGKCHFPSCTHVHEPACAIREAVGAAINPRRYRSYVRLFEEAAG